MAGILRRKAGVVDIPAVRAIALETWPVAYRDILSAHQLEYMLEAMYSEKALREQVLQFGHRFLLAMDGDTANGFASFSEHHGGLPVTRIHKLYTRPAMQGSGIGRLLLAGITEAARTAGDVKLELNVNRHNPAVDFYRKQGFGVVRSEVIPIGEGYVMDDHVMEKQL